MKKKGEKMKKEGMIDRRQKQAVKNKMPFSPGEFQQERIRGIVKGLTVLATHSEVERVDGQRQPGRNCESETDR